MTLENRVEEFLTKESTLYDKVYGKPTFHIRFNGKRAIIDTYIITKEEQNCLLVISDFPFKVPIRNYKDILILITKLNNKILLGNFVLNFDSGEISFKLGFDMDGVTTDNTLRNALKWAMNVMDIYIPTISSRLYGRNKDSMNENLPKDKGDLSKFNLN